MKKVLKTIGIIILAIICIALVALIIEEVRTKHTEGRPMTYAEFCKEWNDCNFIKV
jgi:uncharacterized short protein YbdD (DUF466 family)